MEIARTFRELRVYVAARAAAKRIFEMTKTFPAEERYSLVDQIRRSSRSTKNQIPEAWAKRRYKLAFISKLDDALGECMETQGWLDDCLDAGYFGEPTWRELDAEYQAIGGMLNSMILKADSFCTPPSNTTTGTRR
ncbi:MAG TPA: four helix bundle protein [Verrucomicrobiota bacterium]|nr:four helix bundle protein [Verrucomicrobiota bacterium]